VPTIVIVYVPVAWFELVVVVVDVELEDPQPVIPTAAIPSASTITSSRTARRFRPTKPSISTLPSAIVTGTRPTGADSVFAVFAVAACTIFRRTWPVEVCTALLEQSELFVYSVSVVVTAAVPVTARFEMS